jgi:glutamine---fructose-6-phosphate transaminase (isomerizing)
MCGIIGIVSSNPVALPLVEGLKRLEYRGYDSAGIATVTAGGLDCRRAKGKLTALEAELAAHPLAGIIGIGHTRWATHGAPTVTNAHPHKTDKVAVVHNGIIENFKELRTELEKEGVVFASQTDTEVVPHLLTLYLAQGHTPQEAVKLLIARLEGAFALGIIFADYDNLLIAVKQGSPLAIGYGDGEMYLGSDAFALAPLTNKLSYLEEGDWAELTAGSVVIYDKNNMPVTREIRVNTLSSAAIGKGNYQHYMMKEIMEQPTVIGEALYAYYNPVTEEISLPELPFDMKSVPKVTIIACGTSYYAGLVAKYWLESIAEIPVEIDIASEFRYRDVRLPEDGLVLCISQSGETADTLAALHYARTKKQHIMSIVNVAESSMALASDAFLVTHAGPEIGVASTKAFTTQLVTLACLVLHMAALRNVISVEQSKKYLQSLIEVPGRVAHIVADDSHIRKLAREVANAKDVLYIGRGTSYAVAMEGALKLKELSYLHAEGLAAGELKHGSIALIDESVPVIVIAPSDRLFEKTASNVQEIAARGAKVIAISDKKGAEKLASVTSSVIELPEVDGFAAPILYVVPVQLLAYHVASYKGTDIDQPRNLAKSVTVE